MNGEGSSLPEPRWLTWLANRGTFSSELVSLAGMTMVSISTGYDGSTRTWLVIGGFSVSILALGFRAFRENHRKAQEARQSRQQRRMVRELITELNTIDVVVSRATDPELSAKERREQLAGARSSILAMVRHRVGPDEGVSVNYFEVTDAEKCTLAAAKWGRIGGVGRPSDRVFTPASPTLQLAAVGKGRLVRDTMELEGSEKDENPPYGSFAVAPVYAGTSLFGVITVDAEPVDGLTPLDQELLMNFGSKLATTFIAQGNAKKINMDTFDSPGKIDDEADEGGEPQ